MAKPNRFLRILALVAVCSLLLLALGPMTTFGEPEPDRDTIVKSGVKPKTEAPLDQPNPKDYRRLQQRERLLFSGQTAQAASLATTGTDQLLVILVEFGGPDTATWNPGDQWDPYGLAQVVPGAAGDCSAIITQTTTFTYTGPLHNQIARPPAKADLPAYNTVWTEDFSREHYYEMLFGNGLYVQYTTAAGEAVVIDHRGKSFRQFYRESSKGRYDVDGDVVGWVKLPHSEAWYGMDQCPGARSNAAPPRPASGGYFPGGGNSRQMVRDAIDAVNAAYPDFNWARYDQDGDGIVDRLMIVHAGYGEEESTILLNRPTTTGEIVGEHSIWSHSASVSPPYPASPDGQIKVGPYITMPENGGTNVFAHEYSHNLGTVDLYDTGGYGETSVGFWSLMADDWGGGFPSGTVPMYLEPMHRTWLGWWDPVVRDLSSPDATVKIGQASQKPAGTEDGILIRLPDQRERLATAHSGTYMWWGGKENLLNVLVSHPIDLRGKSSATLSYWTAFDTEPGWDFAFTQVSTDSGITWHSLANPDTTDVHDPDAIGYVVENLPGFSGSSDGWKEETFDLTPYAGQQILIGFRYATDWAVLGNGWFIDDVKVVADGSQVFFDDLETATPGWILEPTSGGWSRFDGIQIFPHAYMVEWRNNQGFDAGLSEGRYSVKDFGMLVWYRNTKYTDNQIFNYLQDPPSVGPKGMMLLVDAHPEPWRYPDSQYVNEIANLNGRIQMRDAAFNLQPTQPWSVSPFFAYRFAEGDPNYVFPSRPAVSSFHDYLGYYPGVEFVSRGPGYSPPRIQWFTRDWDASVVVPATGEYSIRGAGYDGSGIRYAGEPRAGGLSAWYGFLYGTPGNGNPWTNAYGVNIDILSQAADNSWGEVRVYNRSVKEASVTASREAAGYVDSRYMLKNFLGSSFLWTGLDTRPQTTRTMHGVFQFDLSQIPAGSKVLEAEVNIMGKSDQYLSGKTGSEWSLELLDPAVDMQWRRLGYAHVHFAPTSATLSPRLQDTDLAVGTWNSFKFGEDQFATLEARFNSTQRASFRLDGSGIFPRERHIFGWDAAGTNGPSARIVYQAP